MAAGSEHGGEDSAASGGMGGGPSLSRVISRRAALGNGVASLLALSWRAAAAAKLAAALSWRGVGRPGCWAGVNALGALAWQK